MKFRALMTDSTSIQRLNIAVTIMDKFCKNCILRISPEGFFFIAFEEGSDHRPVAWCTLPKGQYFTEYQVVGVNDSHNEIVLSVAPHLLLVTVTNSMKPSCGLKSLRISLTKRRSPCMTCEVYTMEVHPSRISLHDIPVEPKGRNTWEDFVVPELTKDPPDLAIAMPGLEGLENMWDMVRKMSKNVIVCASPQGQLIFKIETDVSTISFNYKDLPVEYSSETDCNDNMPRVRVKSSQFLRAKELCHGPLTKIVLHIYHKKLLMFVATYNELVLNCLVPAVKK